MQTALAAMLRERRPRWHGVDRRRPNNPGKRDACLRRRMQANGTPVCVGG